MSVPADFLKEFLKSSDWEQMQTLLDDAVGASIIWVVNSSGKLIQMSEEKYPDLCRLIRTSEEVSKKCKHSQHAIIQEVRRTGQPIISACYCGLLGFAIPFILDDNIIGIAGGCHNRSDFPITMEKCAEISVACNIDIKDIMVHAKKIKHIPKVEQRRLLSILSVFTGMASLVIKWTSRLFLSLRLEDNYAAQLSYLGEISKLAASELNWEEMLKTITSKTKSILGVKACSIYILDQNHQELVLTATDGLPASAIGRRIKIGTGIIGHAAQNRLALAVEDATDDPRAIIKSGTKKPSYHSILSVPLIAQDRLIGVIDARTSKPKSWSQTDIDFLSIIAEQVAGIIERGKFQMEVSKELEIARYIQTNLLPDAPPEIEGYDLSAITIPNSEIGGDYYDFIPMNNEKLGIVIADVSGKGIGAALLMANTHGLVHAHISSEVGVSDVIYKINNSLYECTELEKFATMFYGVLNTKTGDFLYTNAGHNYPFVYNVGTAEFQSLDVGGTVLGVLKDMRYSEGRIQLDSGSIVVLYSDGVTEARNKDGEMFGDKRLHKIVFDYIKQNSGQLNAKNLLNCIYDAVINFTFNVPVVDDLTIVILIKH